MTETRFSAWRGLVLGFGALALLLCGVAGWGVLASISGAVIAHGRVTVESRNQIVEHIDGGTVGEVLVRDGDLVEQDDILLRFSDSLQRSEEAIIASQYTELVARRNRLEAEFRGSDDIVWDGDLISIAATDPRVKELLVGQERLFRARKAASAGEAAQLRERIGQTQEEIKGLEAQAEAIRRQIDLIRRELTSQRALFEKGLTLLDRVLALERAANDLEGRAGTNRATIARARSRISEFEILILQIGADRVEEAEEQAREARAMENEVQEQLVSIRERMKRMDVRAPVSGTVFGMTVFAPSEVVRPGEPILQIVPGNSDLIAMARIEPIYVDQVYPGQEAILRFTAFPARSTPEFEGYVVRISADAVFDSETGLSWYDVELAVADQRERGPAEGDSSTASLQRGLRGLPDEIALAPGMPVEVHIRTGERTLVGYFAKPLTDFFYRSLREE